MVTTSDVLWNTKNHYRLQWNLQLLGPGQLMFSLIGFLDQRKQTKMHWLQLQDQNQSNVNNLNNVRREASRHFRKKKDGISES